MNKRGQLTLFIILAIAIVIILAVLFFPKIKTSVSPAAPQTFMKDCAKDATEEIIDKVVLQGGSSNPENYLLYQGNKIEYICYTNEYYGQCVMQKPFLKQSIEREINSYVEPRVQECLNNLEQQLEKKGSEVSAGEVEVKASLTKNFIILDIDSPFSVTNEAASSFENFKVNIRSNLYDLIMLSSSIANWEARYGDSNSLSYMLYYPDVKVEKIKRDEGTVYILTDKDTEDRFIFASRSVAWPPGYLGV